MRKPFRLHLIWATYNYVFVISPEVAQIGVSLFWLSIKTLAVPPSPGLPSHVLSSRVLVVAQEGVNLASLYKDVQVAPIAWDTCLCICRVFL